MGCRCKPARVEDTYWDGGKRRKQPADRGSFGGLFVWLERVVIVAALAVCFYGLRIAVTEDLERGAAFAVPAGLVLMLAAWRRGVFEIPWFP